jgi:hypothetical protein
VKGKAMKCYLIDIAYSSKVPLNSCQTLWSSSRESAAKLTSYRLVVEAVWQVINIDKEQQRTQNTPLWDTTRY